MTTSSLTYFFTVMELMPSVLEMLSILVSFPVLEKRNLAIAINWLTSSPLMCLSTSFTMTVLKTSSNCLLQNTSPLEGSVIGNDPNLRKSEKRSSLSPG